MGFVNVCYACHREVSINRTVGRRDTCQCGADLHCCRNCRFYDASASKQCTEPVAELVKEKTKANFCGFFVFAASSDSAAQENAATQARKALDDLFKK